MSTPGTQAAESTETPAAEGDAGAAEETAAEEGAEEAEGGTDVPASEGEEAAAAGAEGEIEEGEEKPAEEAKEPPKPTLTEDELKVAARKFANQTMAAARRAEARVEAVKTENATLKTENKVYADFVQELRTSPGTAIRKVGFAGIQAFLEAVRDGGEPKDPTAEDRVTALEKQIKERDEKAAAAAREAAIADAQGKVFAAIDGDKARFARTATRRGHAELWDAITAYHEMHGDVPDAAVFALADEVEKGLRAEFGDPVSVQRQDATKPGAPAGKAAPAGRNSGKTLTNKQTSGAPTTREYSLDPDERRKQITEELRAEGLL